MKKKIRYEEILFTCFVHTNFVKEFLGECDGEGKFEEKKKEFFESYKVDSESINTINNLLPKISEMLYSIIWLNAEDEKISNIKPSQLGIVDVIGGCDDETQFLRHLRNAISHKRCNFYDDGSVEFWDANKNKENFRIELTKEKFELLLEEFRYLAVREFYPLTIKNAFLIHCFIGNNCTIGKFAFCGNYNLETCTIPQHIKEIPDWSFCNCKKLKAIGVPTNVNTIGKRAFSGCEKLSAIVLSNNEQLSIGDYAFAECTFVDSIIINTNFKLGRRVFAGWNKKQKIIVQGDEHEMKKNWKKDWKEGCKATIDEKQLIKIEPL